MDTESEPEESDLLNGRTGEASKVKIQSFKRDGRPDSLPEIELNEYKWDKSDSTPTGSFKRKFVFTVPGVMKQKQPREYKLKAFVVFIFFLIIIYLSLTYVFHKQTELQILQTEFAEGIHFYERSRTLRILNSSRHDILFIQMGQYLPEDLVPYECTTESSIYNRCYRWKNAGQLIVKRKPLSANDSSTIRCYDVTWDSLISNVPLSDCFSTEGASWFGFGDFVNGPWPLKVENNFEFTPFVTGNRNSTFGAIINRYLLSSKGVIVSIDDSAPLFISMNKKTLCLKTEPKWPYYNHIPNSSLTLKYSVCAGSNIKDLHEYFIEKFRPKLEVKQNLKFLIEQTIWTTKSITTEVNATSLIKLADDIMELKIPDNILLVIDKWEKEAGDFTFDPHKFPSPQDTVDIIRLKGFNISLQVHPYISTSSANYLKHINYWIRDERNVVPALTSFNNIPSAAILDFTNPFAFDWFLKQLQFLPVSNFVFLGGQSGFLPIRYSLYSEISNPDILSQLYVSLVSNLALELSTASTTQSDLGFVRVSPRSSTWDGVHGLQSVIPLVLSLGLSGFPFINPGTIGGEETPSAELHLRWFQMAIFLPVLQLSDLPKVLIEKYNFEEVKKLLELRRQLVVPLLNQMADEALEKNIPIIRPLWWVAPNDSIALDIDSEFMVGNDLLVAPVLEESAQFRDIYIPHGIWQKEGTGRLVAGPKWLIREQVSMNQVPYFTRVIL